MLKDKHCYHSVCYNPTVTMAQAMLSDDICGDNSGDIDVTTTVSATVLMKGKYRTYTAAFKLSTIEEVKTASIRSVGRKYNIN